MSLDSLIQLWRSDPDTAPNFSIWQTSPPRPAQTSPLPAEVPAGLQEALSRRGIHFLYSHQLQAWEHARAGKNIVIATGTASGKTLAYNLPVITSILNDDTARALYLFPTKALAQDQLATLERLNVPSLNVPAAIYDGDTPQRDRAVIRKKARIILSNPDMLHTGILPHHTNWADFFQGLRFVVIDEMHTYRGVFGSHIANVLRRLKRIAKFYGAHPQFILTSATIGNPRELGERLIEAPVELVERDGSARGERHFLLYDPPVIDEALGLRKSSIMESVRLAQDLGTHNIQSVIFARSRRSVEIILTYLQEKNRISKLDHPSSDARPSSIEPPNSGSPIRGYRSGYLPSQRREIEKGLRAGTVQTVVATNALELGIDIGGLGAAVLVGYPGSIASLTQQAGRAGRGEAPALALLVASANPLDQFLAHHPDYFSGRSPEQALINPDHLLILLNHLRCAMFELPFQKGETFGSLEADKVEEFLTFLISNNEAHLSQDKFYWMSDTYPAANISLRSASPENVILQTTDDRPQTIGEIDLASAFWMVHPKAVYLHEGQQYYVHSLDLEKNLALVTAVALDYYTEPQRETEVQILSVSEQSPLPSSSKGRLERNSAKRAGARSRLQHRSLASKNCAGLRVRTSAKSRSTCRPPTCKPQAIGFHYRKRWSRHCASAEHGPTTRTITAPIGRASVWQSGRATDSAARSAVHLRMDASMTSTIRSLSAPSCANGLRLPRNSHRKAREPRVRSIRTSPSKMLTGSTTSSRFARHVTTKRNRTCACVRGWPGYPMS